MANLVEQLRRFDRQVDHGAGDVLESAASEIERLRAALKPFDDAYRLSAKLCASQSLGDWEAMAKHHTAPGAYRAACIAFSSESGEADQ